MMIVQKAYSIRDSKAGFYGPVMLFNTHGEAERALKTETKNPQSKISMYPEDYDLFHIGEFNNQTGKFQSLETPQHVVKAINLVDNNAQPALN